MDHRRSSVKADRSTPLVGLLVAVLLLGLLATISIPLFVG